MSKIYFEEELQIIKNEEVRNLVIEVLKNVKDDFYHAPASSTGKYHPSYSLDRDSSPCPRTIGQYDPRK